MKLIVTFKNQSKEILEAFLWALLEWKYLGQFDMKFTFEVDKE